MEKIIVGRPLDGMAIIVMEGKIIFIRDLNVPSGDLCEMPRLLEMDMNNWEEPGIAIRDNYCP